MNKECICAEQDGKGLSTCGLNCSVHNITVPIFWLEELSEAAKKVNGDSLKIMSYPWVHLLNIASTSDMFLELNKKKE